MSEPGKFKRSWLLLTTSLRVLSQHRKLLVFPLISAVFAVVTVAFFMSPAVFVPTGYSIASGSHWIAVGERVFENSTSVDSHGRVPGRPVPRPWFFSYLALAYLVFMFLATFANVAFVNEIFNALNGRTVSIRSGLLFAWSRIGSILVWSLFAGVVGLVIQSLERRFGWIGNIILRLVGVVWSVASIFAIPVIVRDPSLNPVALLRTSARTLRKTWGEALVGYIGIQGAAALFVIGIMAVAFPAVISGFSAGRAWAIAVAALWLVSVFALAYTSAVADQIYRCALYIYASEGVTPGPYSAAMMDMAWKIKGKNGRGNSAI